MTTCYTPQINLKSEPKLIFVKNFCSNNYLICIKKLTCALKAGELWLINYIFFIQGFYIKDCQLQTNFQSFETGLSKKTIIILFVHQATVVIKVPWQKSLALYYHIVGTCQQIQNW
ncbi:hypothetical protein BpHYR1_024663 [Brachionus plicatilis]|uniref:Uncharacterized protein n=1 Tax=Brachionus plicatilis TaxID=10195 RepID=A0A3M7PPK5_BRAPC|nr:hypothetical protein BpHYR1_024663 [Brachionus plicatilis]